MKRSTLYLLLVVAAFAVLATWLVLKNRNATLRKELRDFAVTDTASITKIFLADRNKNKILLERKSAFEWTVNGTDKARQAGINQLLATVKNVAVRTRVAKSYYNLTLKDLATTGIKCEIYQDDAGTPMKVYYVGGSTQDILGTYMMLEESSVPFITEIPGFNGYLTPRYTTNLNDWRDRSVFSFRMEELLSLQIQYPALPTHSFRIDQENSRFVIKSGDGSSLLQNPDTAGLANYLRFFGSLPFEDWDNELDARQKDSLKASTPLAVISVTLKSGVREEAVLHHKAISQRSLSLSDEKGEPLRFDLDRMYAFTRQGKELVVVQYFSFGKVLRQLNDFDLSARNKGAKNK
jgi:hypothetical protein